MKNVIKAACFYLLFLCLMIALFSQKSNFHMDEVWSYGLANHDGDIVMDAELGKKYDPEAPFLDYLAVRDDQRFDYSKVWENQRNDNHPVLYYVLLHTISSFYPGTFSKWFGAVINIAFGLLLLFALRQFLLVLTRSSRIRDLVSLAFILTYGVLNAMTFIRMYVMAMFWVTALAFAMLRLLDKEQGRPASEGMRASPLWYDLLAIYAITALSGVTHYYCIVWSVFLTLGAVVFLLVKKRWKGALRLLGVQAVAAGTAVAIFPTILFHIFSGDRGSQSMENLQNTSEDAGHFMTYFRFLNKELFGGLLILFLVVLIAFVVASYVRKQEGEPERIAWGYYLVLLFPSVLYYLVISMTTTMQTDRYLYPIYPVLFAMVFGLLGTGINRVLPEQKTVTSMLLGAALVLSIGFSYTNPPAPFFEYLYTPHKAYLQTAEQYKDYDCLCVYHARYQLPTTYLEAKNYKSITFLWEGNLKHLDELDIANSDKLIVRVIDEHDGMNVMDTILDHYTQFSDAEELFTYWAGTTSVLK